MPQPAQVLRRALFIWGWGHATLGDRRGWLFAVIQLIAIADWLIVAVQLIDGTRWLAVFVPLVLIIVFWVGQAVHAYRRAIRLGGAPGGELQVAAFLPLVLAVFTAFWLIAGRHGSAASTVEAYIEAWEANRPDIGRALLAHAGYQGPDPIDLWPGERSSLVAQVTAGEAAYGPTSGLDPMRPFSSLRVSQTSANTFVVEIVRSETFQTKLLGLIQTSGQRSVTVATLFTISCVEQPSGGVGGSSVWLIDNLAGLQGV